MAGEVKYWLNGVFFKDYGVRVSSSPGLFDTLKRKAVQQYSWAEYHGDSPDLTRPRFEARTFELKCFIDGDNWKVMFNKFNTAIRDQFYKSGSQRLEIEPFGISKLAYEVYALDEIKIEKTFKEGRNIGVFSIKMIEPNPIKKVLKTTLDSFKLSYEIDSQTEIFFGDGTKQIGRSNVSLIKDYSSPSYDSSGISLVSTSGINSQYFEVYAAPDQSEAFQFSVEVNILTSKNVILYVIGRKLTGDYVPVAISTIYEGLSGKNTITVVQELKMPDFGKFIYKVLDSDGNEVSGITLHNPRIETAEVIGEWQNMLGKEKIIIIAGNIEDLKNLQTPAEIIWDKI